MNFRNLEAFTHVSRFGSFSKAAEMLYLTQPSISARIQSLEREVGVQLFERVGRHAVLTEIGKLYLPYAENVLKAYHESQKALWRHTEGTVSELVIASTLSICAHFLPFVIPVFHKKFPDVTINITTGQSHDILEMVLQQRVDFGITRTISHAKINRHRLFIDQVVLAVFPGHPLEKMQSVTMEEVACQPLILYDQGSPDWILINSAFQSEGITPNTVMNVQSIDAVKRLVQQKVGISFLPFMAIKEELSSGRLVAVPVKDIQSLARNIDLIEPHRVETSLTLNTFKNIIIEGGKKWGKENYNHLPEELQKESLTTC